MARTEPKSCGVVCICMQLTLTYHGNVCEIQVSWNPTATKWVNAANDLHNQYSSKSFKFTDIQPNVYSFYHQANLNDICRIGFTLTHISHTIGFKIKSKDSV